MRFQDDFAGGGSAKVFPARPVHVQQSTKTCKAFLDAAQDVSRVQLVPVGKRHALQRPLVFAVSVLHAEEPSQCFLAWLPDPGDYINALEGQGYDRLAGAAALPADEQACAEPLLAARLHNLALALRLLPATLAAAEARSAGVLLYSLPVL